MTDWSCSRPASRRGRTARASWPTPSRSTGQPTWPPRRTPTAWSSWRRVPPYGTAARRSPQGPGGRLPGVLARPSSAPCPCNLATWQRSVTPQEPSATTRARTRYLHSTICASQSPTAASSTAPTAALSTRRQGFRGRDVDQRAVGRMLRRNLRCGAHPQDPAQRRQAPPAPNLSQLIAALAALPGRPDIALTTNGVLLAQHASELAAAGVTRPQRPPRRR